jgi:hypothetical protein
MSSHKTPTPEHHQSNASMVYVPERDENTATCTKFVHHSMTQYSLKKGLNKFKNIGEEAVSKELLQLHM